MRSIFLIVMLIYSFSFYAQNDSIAVAKEAKLSVVSADKMNVVYRGLQNQISIAVSDCKSFEVSGEGLTKISDGKYELSPGQGLETIIIVDIVLKDESILQEKHSFRINNMPNLHGAINGLICNQSILLMTKKELNESIISIKFENDFVFNLAFDIKSFTLKIKDKYIEVSGNKFSKNALELINTLQLNSFFEIVDFKSTVECSNCMPQTIKLLKIMIVE